jgi:hypothetical protein
VPKRIGYLVGIRIISPLQDELLHLLVKLVTKEYYYRNCVFTGGITISFSEVASSSGYVAPYQIKYISNLRTRVPNLRRRPDRSAKEINLRGTCIPCHPHIHRWPVRKPAVLVPAPFQMTAPAISHSVNMDAPGPGFAGGHLRWLTVSSHYSEGPSRDRQKHVRERSRLQDLSS